MLKRARGDRAGGMKDLDRAIELDPRLPSAWSNRGIARRLDGDLPGAISDYEKALEVAPADWNHRERVKRDLEQMRRE